MFVRICYYFHTRIPQIFTPWSSRWQFLLLILAKSVRPIKSEYAIGLPMFCTVCWWFTDFSHCLDHSTFRNPSRKSLSIIFNIYLPKYWPNGCEFHWKIRRWSTVILPTLGTKSSDILSFDGQSYSARGRSRSKFTKERSITLMFRHSFKSVNKKNYCITRPNQVWVPTLEMNYHLFQMIYHICYPNTIWTDIFMFAVWLRHFSLRYIWFVIVKKVHKKSLSGFWISFSSLPVSISERKQSFESCHVTRKRKMKGSSLFVTQLVILWAKKRKNFSTEFWEIDRTPI